MDLDQALNILGLEKNSDNSHYAFSYKMPKRILEPEFAKSSLRELQWIAASMQVEQPRLSESYRIVIQAWILVNRAIQSHSDHHNLQKHPKN